MILETIRDFVADKLTVPVLCELPESSVPTSLVVLEQIGSGNEDKIQSVRVAAQSYGATLYAAAELNETAKAAMAALIELGSISAAHLVNDYNFTDTETKRYRYQAIFDIYF